MKKNNFSLLWAYLRFHLIWLLCGFFLAIASSLLTLLIPIFIGQIIDQLTPHPEATISLMRTSLQNLLLVILFSSLSQWGMTLFIQRAIFPTIATLRLALFQHLSQLSLPTMEQQSHGDLMSTISTDIEQLSEGLLLFFMQLLPGLVTIVGTLWLMLHIHLQMALMVFILTPLSLLVSTFLGKWSAHHFQKQMELRGQMSDYIKQMVHGQMMVKILGYEKTAQHTFEQVNQHLYHAGLRSQFYSAIANPTTRFINAIIYVVVAMVGGLGALSGNVSVGQLASFLFYSNQYNKPFNEISSIFTQLQAAVASCTRIATLFDLPIEPHRKHLPDFPLSSFDGSLSFQEVGFSYQPGHPILHALHFSVSPGQRIAIVGKTGCGKTTLMNLIMGFYPVTTGEIFLSGLPMSAYNPDSFSKLFGMVLQDPWLFSGTITENICYGKPHATHAQMIAASKQAYAHEWICQLEHGYNTLLSTGGQELSPGQRQLICIARVMLTRPSILILDEATSHIDTRTELKISQAFSEMMQHCTSFVVAHRLSTVQQADLILVMDHGQIVEQGSHQVLLNQQGYYAKLYYRQFQHTQ